MTRRNRIVAALAGLVTALVGSLVTVNPAQAAPSGGGCNYANANGAAAHICVAYSSGTVLGDFYIDSVRSCSRTRLTIWGTSPQIGPDWYKAWEGNSDCFLGRHGPVHLPGPVGTRWKTALQIFNAAGSPIWWLESPILSVNP